MLVIVATFISLQWENEERDFFCLDAIKRGLSVIVYSKTWGILDHAGMTCSRWAGWS